MQLSNGDRPIVHSFSNMCLTPPVPTRQHCSCNSQRNQSHPFAAGCNESQSNLSHMREHQRRSATKSPGSKECKCHRHRQGWKFREVTGGGKQWDLLSQELRPRSSSATGTASPLERAPGVGEERSCSTFPPTRRCATEDKRQSLDISSFPKFCSSDNRDKCLLLVVRDWKDFCDEQTRRQG